MRQTHTNVFFTAAQECTCWIGLREPNDLSDKWIGKHGFVPKSEACKAKSANNPRHQFGGLVMDPILCPEAFLPASLAEAVNTWRQKFTMGGQLPPKFSRAESGPEKGLVKENGSAIYADFDLMALSRSNAEGEFLFTSLEEQKELYRKVEPILNRGLGAKLIQHPAEFMWEKGIGARAFENILWFGPGRRSHFGISSIQDMPICPRCNVWHAGQSCPLLH
jgi:hypothetical protein